MTDPSRDVRLTLPYDEAAVLSDWLHRAKTTKAGLRGITSDRAETIALESLLATLEPLIDEVFAADYDAFIIAAKGRLSTPS